MMMPSIVKAARILFLISARKATRMIISKFIVDCPFSCRLRLRRLRRQSPPACFSLLLPRRADRSIGSSLLILPSLKTMTRCAYCAMSVFMRDQHERDAAFAIQTLKNLHHFN